MLQSGTKYRLLKISPMSPKILFLHSLKLKLGSVWIALPTSGMQHLSKLLTNRRSIRLTKNIHQLAKLLATSLYTLTGSVLMSPPANQIKTSQSSIQMHLFTLLQTPRIFTFYQICYLQSY